MLNFLSDPAPDHVFEISEFALAGVSPRNPSGQNREHFHERALTPSPSLPNFIRPQLFRDALTKVAAANGARRLNTALVIPDYAARMAILEFEDFPEREEDRISLLRFRLRKTVPFHIEEARLAYSVQESRPGHLEILAVAIANPILHEYEAIFVDAGHRVGLVVPSLIAALPFCNATEGGITLLAKSAGTTLSIGLIEKDPSAPGALHRSEHRRTGRWRPSRPRSFPILQQTLAFAEDQLEQKVKQAILCVLVRYRCVGEQLEYEFGIPYAPVSSRFGPAHGRTPGCSAYWSNSAHEDPTAGIH